MTTMKKRILSCMLAAGMLIPTTASAWYGLGDMNADDCLNAFDLAIMKRKLNEEKDHFDYEEYPMEADLNENDAFTAYDVKLMQSYVLGKIGSFSDTPMISSKALASGTERTEKGKMASTAFKQSQMDFAANLFKQTAQNQENTLISPISVSIALSMTANGADKQTRTEMENVLGLSVEDINEYMAYYLTHIGNSSDARVNIANSVWFRDDEELTVEEDFLDTNSNYYDAEIYASPFDAGTVKDVNSWVEGKTDGMIPELIREISPDTMLMLINAIAFDAKWSNPYEDYQVKDGTFTAADGTEQDVQMLHCDGDDYYEFENAVGFSKAYEGHGYRFVAILPDEGMTVSEWIAQMDSEAVLTELSEPERDYIVITQTPKFKYETDLKLKDVLSAMGMSTAFDRTEADFYKMGKRTVDGFDYPLYIGEVLHKTCIDLNESGTRAAAVTAVIMNAAGDAPSEEEPIIKYITLDRPFVYMIVDNNNIPLFMGTVQSVE